MTNILTDWRQALVTHLAANLQAGSFEVLSGERDGAAKRNLACVFVPAIAEASNILFASPPMIVRAWIPKPRTRSEHLPAPDPAPLEQLAFDLMTTLEPVQTTLVAGIYFWVDGIRFDYVDWGVEATLTSFTSNPATIA